MCFYDMSDAFLINKKVCLILSSGYYAQLHMFSLCPCRFAPGSPDYLVGGLATLNCH